MPDSKPLLVGELNPYGTDPYFALYPEPVGASGDRLCRYVMGLSRGDYMARFDRVNLCTGKWSVQSARRAAEAIVAQQREVMVLLGAKVARAFGHQVEPFTILHSRAAIGRIVLLPHPSGLSRAWNEPTAVARARAVLRMAGVLLEPEAANAGGEG